MNGRRERTGGPEEFNSSPTLKINTFTAGLI